MTAPEPHDAWWTIHSSVVQEMLRRAFHGEDPDLLYVELIANSRIEPVDNASESGAVLHQPHVEPCDRADCRHTRRLLAQSCLDLDEATEIIVDLTNQACSTADGLDSMAISAYAEAIDYLAKRGIVEIDHQAGRRVTARWVQR